MTHNEKVLRLLQDGKPHSYHEGYRLGVMLHSRVADLRKQGHVIECVKTGGDYLYRLLGSVGADGATDAGGGAPAGSLGSSASPPSDSPSLTEPDGLRASPSDPFSGGSRAGMSSTGNGEESPGSVSEFHDGSVPVTSQGYELPPAGGRIPLCAPGQLSLIEAA